MMRLLTRGLIYGNLFEVSSKTLVKRYNRALEHLIGKKTELSDFHIDISGFSPEIADELEDDLYLNPDGCNRLFILLSTEQKRSPLLNAKFSTSHAILKRFIESNEHQLFSLTAREAVTGEMVNSVLKLDKASQLLQLREITIEADTTGSRVAAGDELSEKIDRFMSEDDAWWDDVLTAEMIELAKTTGDIVRHPVNLGQNHFIQENFYTSHFGGLYLFRDTNKPTIICFGRKNQFNSLLDFDVISHRETGKIAKFLHANNLIEAIIYADKIDAEAILKQKLDFILIDSAADAGEDLTDVSRRDLRDMRRRHESILPKEHRSLNKLHRWARNPQGIAPFIPLDNPAYLYAFRSSEHKDKDLVNMLLAQLCPLDFRQLYICHKQAFYDAYADWNDQKKEYVAKFLGDEYLIDKVGAREQLFGPELSMWDNAVFDAADQLTNDMEEDNEPPIGPWGPLSIDG